MALWCSNTFTITGPEPDLIRFLALAPGTRRAISGQVEVKVTEALDFENFVPGANDEIGKGSALNSRLKVREPGRATFSFETPYSSPVGVFARVAEQFPGLEFHCEFLGEERTYQGRFHARGGESTIEYYDVLAEFFGFGLEAATPQSSLVTLRVLKQSDAWSFRGRLLGTPQGRLLLGLGQARCFQSADSYEWAAGVYEWVGGEFRPLHLFNKDQSVTVQDGFAPAGPCLFCLARNQDWATHHPGLTTLRRLDASGDLSELFTFADPSFGPNVGSTALRPDCVLPRVQTADGELYGLAYDGNTVALPGQFDVSGVPVTLDCGVLFRLGRDGRREDVHRFSGEDDTVPGSLVLATDGRLYGLTSTGGPNQGDTFFSVAP